ncbi:bestrophin family ion channel [Cryomorphaceae bacterium 1068]|nr:bestrophin family ion channel [Cryomorphaceae bacterium 1068]
MYSLICSSLVWVIHVVFKQHQLTIPTGVVGILGTALAIILGFRNTSAYERWWEARKIWGGIVNESRTFTRQALTIVDRTEVTPELWENCSRIVRTQLAFINALRLQLRSQDDSEEWKTTVGKHLREDDYANVMSKTNKATHLGMLMGYAIKELNAHETMDTFSYIQMDDTLTRITDLQGRAERIKSTPLPMPYDYYTMSFLVVFVFFFPFAFIERFIEFSASWLIIPITVIISWIFYQIYVIGSVMSKPFAGWKTDVAMTDICTTIEIDLKEVIGDSDIPEKLKPKGGALM